MTAPTLAKAHPTPTAVLERLGRRNLADEAKRIAREHHVDVHHACSRIRTKSVAAARHAVWSMLRANGLSTPEIGAIFGVDPTTVGDATRDEMKGRAA